ncbi:hypothetical protein [Helicobacter sp. 11S02629-2]|uniref:hypothetical protein n=1 Tax=Helicobacter sp. 11S02629-2 TaxID=1476195 RepID=UPI000BA620FD|nr:hypothetical protein [Helicobacter sp. 11S02629-2]PAF44178.1 hypothetical protein BKH40_06165 [Helicobacter sp. 11S02629-2]
MTSLIVDTPSFAPLDEPLKEKSSIRDALIYPLHKRLQELEGIKQVVFYSLLTLEKEHLPSIILKDELDSIELNGGAWKHSLDVELILYTLSQKERESLLLKVLDILKTNLIVDSLSISREKLESAELEVYALSLKLNLKYLSEAFNV